MGKIKSELFVACSGGRHLAPKLASQMKSNYRSLSSLKFPDTEIKVRFTENIKNLDIYLIQSFYPASRNISDKIIEVILAGKTAKELGAKDIYLIAPYFPYIRQDARFRKGEAVSSKIIAELFKMFKKVFIVEPHLHRFKSFSEFFPNAKKVSLAEETANYIKKEIGLENTLIVGPDAESEQWVKPVAEKLKLNYEILEKERFTATKVKTKGKKSTAEKVVIIDDIISTGGTLVEACKFVEAKKIYFIGTHGLFSHGVFKKLDKKGETIVSNTIPTKKSSIDCTKAIIKAIK